MVILEAVLDLTHVFRDALVHAAETALLAMEELLSPPVLDEGELDEISDQVYDQLPSKDPENREPQPDEEGSPPWATTRSKTGKGLAPFEFQGAERRKRQVRIFIP